MKRHWQKGTANAQDVKKEKNKGVKRMLRTVMVVVFLISSSVCDMRNKKIPLWVIIIFAGLGVLLAIFAPAHSFGDLVAGVGGGVVLIMVSIITAGQIGMGDGLLFVVLGIFCGSSNIGLLIYATLLCAVVAGVLFMTRQVKRNDRLPFVPFVLCVYIGQLLINI